VASGASDPALRGLQIPAGARSLALEAFRSGTPRFSPDAPAQGWALASRHGARAVATQPVVVDGRCIGVLSVFWDVVRPQLGVRTSRLLGLLVHEAATAFARSALFARLAQQSRTDALTGVLNRRALDDELHLALLKGACAAWSAVLRGGDVLARFGGEEFVVVLPGCAVSDAQALVDRLRISTPSGQTCSAGVAGWDGAEAASELIVRADQALYRAKARGRDMVCVA
ncbi:MAG: sensor diguanylate cyclase, partial [Conexibacter sp.]|nr:sensor diguanylate cyclase [Conexibacter sp.]